MTGFEGTELTTGVLGTGLEIAGVSALAIVCLTTAFVVSFLVGCEDESGGVVFCAAGFTVGWFRIGLGVSTCPAVAGLVIVCVSCFIGWDVVGFGVALPTVGDTGLVVIEESVLVAWVLLTTGPGLAIFCVSFFIIG